MGLIVASRIEEIIKLKEDAYRMLTEDKEEEIRIVCENDNYDIATEASFIGGESEDCWMSSMLGNYSYDNAETIINKVFDLIEENQDTPIYVEFA